MGFFFDDPSETRLPPKEVSKAPRSIELRVVDASSQVFEMP
jgi:hypothetical protein